MESNNQKRFNAAVVVGGRDDTKGLKQSFPGIETIKTSGSEVSDQTLTEIKKLARTRETIIFTDPGYNSERIRRLMTNAASNAKQAFITRKEEEPTKRGNSLGVEHASKEALVRALGDLHETQAVEGDITKGKYSDLGFVVSLGARLLREKVGTKLGIGYGSSGQFLKRLKMFRTIYDELKRAVEGVK